MRTNAELAAEALRIFRAGLAAVDPHRAVTRALAREADHLRLVDDAGEATSIDLGRFERVLVVGAGKATARMCQAVEELLGDHLTEGVAIVKDGHRAPTQTIRLYEAAHPVPDGRGLEAARSMVELVDGADELTLVIALLSGGGSALLTLPADGLSLDDKRAVTDALLAAGADIGEINSVRKHLSAVKGGRLAARAEDATWLTLMLSDVIGDRPDVIASGPTVGDGSTFADACRVLDRYDLWGSLPPPVVEHLNRGVRGEVPETPKPDRALFARSSQRVVGSNRLALAACERAARAGGWHTTVLSSTIEGETREVGRARGAMAREILATASPVARPACVISGGETTVTLRSSGRGGRNQELALSAALAFAGTDGVALLSAGTDGTDGPTDAAGAIAFGNTVRRARERGFEAERHLERHDAYPLFDAIGDLVRTGPTGTNVMDVHLLLVS
ncbi:MAG: glycerate kinase [Deltaproteobacteria bacterium]|jgi:hydroxypyruvate reductase|nr:glycerate kinase [Deltaproteobacteria bacterium]MBW2530232.1 glycerate kinase [Deltaproteobacteria bacterium]